MKRCTKCGELKPESEFYKNCQQKSGLDPQCKQCKNKVHYLYMHNRTKGNRKPKQVISKMETTTDVLGGYKISILKYAKAGEYKFNIVSTTGNSFKTNDKAKFLNKVQDLVSWLK